MKYIFSIITALLLSLGCKAQTSDIQITDNDSFAIISPKFSQMDLICLDAPDTIDKKIVCCAAASFTGLIRPGQNHLNIGGNHIANGAYYKGFKCGNNTGGFIFYKDGNWKFANNTDYASILENNQTNIQCAFGQCMVVLDSIEQKTFPKGYDHVANYRVLAEIGKQLCLFESTVPMTLKRYLKELQKYHPANAAYMEMGTDWNYTWWRNINGNCTMQHPLVNGSNWIVFKTF